MKGLVIKDLMCLRKQRITFCYVVVAAAVLAVMFVLSSRFGNIYRANQTLMSENQVDAAAMNSISVMVLAVFMFLPFAVAADVATIFANDGKAGFSQVCASLPLPVYKRVLARYITVFVVFGIGFIIDLLIAVLLSAMTDIIKLTDFLKIIISAASLMSMYAALTILNCYLLGYGKESLAQISSILVLLLAFILINIRHIKGLFIDMNLLSEASDFIRHRFYVLLIMAVLTMAFSYIAAVALAKRKRGIV